MIQGSIASGYKRFFPPPECPDWLWAHTSSYSLGIGGSLPPGIKQPGHDADHVHPLMLRLRMSGALPLLLLYAFMVCIGTTLPSYL
jgi:hypothetical protein